LLQREAIPSDDHIAQTLVRRATLVRRRRRGGEPPFVNSATV
jgi:hypothetical protein